MTQNIMTCAILIVVFIIFIIVAVILMTQFGITEQFSSETTVPLGKFFSNKELGGYQTIASAGQKFTLYNPATSKWQIFSSSAPQNVVFKVTCTGNDYR